MGLWDWRNHGSSMELSEPVRDTSNAGWDGTAAVFYPHRPYGSAGDAYGGDWRYRSFPLANRVRHRLSGIAARHQAMGTVLCRWLAGHCLSRSGRHTNNGS